jgi:hypothetical protein
MLAAHFYPGKKGLNFGAGMVSYHIKSTTFLCILYLVHLVLSDLFTRIMWDRSFSVAYVFFHWGYFGSILSK